MWDEQFEELVRGFLPFLSADEELAPDADLRALGLDSIGMVELLSVLESHYAVRFSDESLSLETFAEPAVLWARLSALFELTT